MSNIRKTSLVVTRIPKLGSPREVGVSKGGGKALTPDPDTVDLIDENSLRETLGEVALLGALPTIDTTVNEDLRPGSNLRSGIGCRRRGHVDENIGTLGLLIGLKAEEQSVIVLQKLDSAGNLMAGRPNETSSFHDLGVAVRGGLIYVRGLFWQEEIRRTDNENGENEANSNHSTGSEEYSSGFHSITMTFQGITVSQTVSRIGLKSLESPMIVMFTFSIFTNHF